MARPKTHIRLNICVPEVLRKEMADFVGVNWSAIATVAFYRVVRHDPSGELEIIRLRERVTELETQLQRIKEVVNGQ